MAARYHSNGLPVIDQRLIDDVVATIVDRFHPRRIVVFGSQARGAGGPDSDLDLMVEMESDLRPVERAIAVGDLFPDRRFPLDVVVYTPEEIARDTGVVGTLLSMIEGDGRTVYEQARVTT
jgi:uncharacterized protein